MKWNQWTVAEQEESTVKFMNALLDHHGSGRKVGDLARLANERGSGRTAAADFT